MNLSSLVVDIDDNTYQAALVRAQQEGKTLNQALEALLTSYAQASGGQSQTYTVQRGDTLSKIARDVYGDAHKYPLIQKANNIANANHIWVGQVLVIPSVSGVVAPPSPAPARPTPTPLQPPSPPSGSTAAPPNFQSQSLVANYIKAMPKGLRKDRTRNINVVYQFQVAGEGAWTVAINNQQAAVTRGQTAPPTAIISLSAKDFIKLAQGQLNTVQAYQQGRLQIQGDVNLAAKITDFFAPWAGSGGEIKSDDGSSSGSDDTDSGSSSGGSTNSQLLNGSFDDYQPFVYEGDTKVWKEDRFPEEYGSHWALDIVDVGKSRLHMMNSGVFGKFTQKYFGGSGLDYHQHGRYSQVVTSRYSFDVVFRQTVTAQPGQTYTFGGMIVSFYKGTGGERKDGMVFKTIGIDPTGGREWNSPNVVWGERDGKDNEWRYPKVQAKAQGNAITVFIRLENTADDVGQTELNIIHLEKFELK